MTDKLTKKQQKAIKNRTRVPRATRKAEKVAALEGNALPDGVDAEDPVPGQENKVPVEGQIQSESSSSSSSSRKRKRKGGDEAVGTEAKKPKPEKAKRFLCFCGNLSYSITVEDIQSHFKTDDEVPVVRLSTPKVDPVKGETRAKTKSKGRKINVELSAGGGGKGETRKAKIAKQREKLTSQRQKAVEKIKNAKDIKSKDNKLAVEKQEKEPPKEKTVKKPWNLSGSNSIKLG